MPFPLFPAFKALLLPFQIHHLILNYYCCMYKQSTESIWYCSYEHMYRADHLALEMYV